VSLPAPTSDRIETPSGVGIVVHEWGGHGDPVLLAHPTGFHGRAWGPIAAKLVRAGRRVWSFDFRGHGDSDPSPGGAYRWEEFADDALAVTDHLGLRGTRRLLAAGHSKGAAALLWGAAREPGVYPRIWCFEPIIIPTESPVLAPSDNPLSAGARKRRDVWPSREEASASYAAKPPLSSLTPASLAAYVEYGLRDRPDGTVELKCRPEDEATMYQMGASLGLFPHLPEVDVPVLVACGEHSDAIGPDFAEAIAAKLRHGTLEVWDKRGHFGPLEDPDHAAESMLHFAQATA
jgi:pimeloyl-ACP methyl ester carboxylesterase